MKTCVTAGLPAAMGICLLLSAAGTAIAQESGSKATEQTSDQSATEPADTTALPKVVVTSPKEKKKSSTKKVEGKGAGSDSAGGGVTNEASAQDDGGVGGGATSDAEGVTLGGPAVSDTGTTTYDARNVRSRSVGGGDANTFVRNAPNVQYQDQTSTDAGTNPYREIDTQPMEFSINGGRTYQNNIVMNGVSINNVVGPIENSDARLDDDPYPVTDVLYGVHPQTVYVPVEFLDTATIIDSNASANTEIFKAASFCSILLHLRLTAGAHHSPTIATQAIWFTTKSAPKRAPTL